MSVHDLIAQVQAMSPTHDVVMRREDVLQILGRVSAFEDCFRALLDLRSTDTTACAGCGAVLVTQEDPTVAGQGTPDVWCDRCAACWPREGRVEFPQAPLIRALAALAPPGPNCEAVRWVSDVHAWLNVWVEATGYCRMGKIGCDRLKAGPAYGGFFCAPEWPPHSGPCNPVLHECAGAGS